MTPELTDLLASPNYYIQAFRGEAALFMPMDREAYHRSIFLDARISPAANRPVQVPVRRLANAVPSPLPISWIFHVAHCGSTLLARALDQLHTNLVLREPLALRQLAFANQTVRRSVLISLLSRRYRAELPTVVKANVPVNFLLPDLVGYDAHTRSIFLYLDLDDYLFAVLHNDGNRLWLRRVTTQLKPYLGDCSALTDPERAAALWKAQIERFANAIARFPCARSLDAEDFFAAPQNAIQRAADHLKVPMTDDEIAAVVTGPLFATYSKKPDEPFNNEMRLAQRSNLERSLAAELEQGRTWLAGNGGAGKAIEVIAGATLRVRRGSAAIQAAAADL